MRMINMYLRSVLISGLILSTAWGQTMISGSVSGNWTSRDNPYQLTADAVVAVGDTLIIDSGVVVDLGFSYELRIQGTLLANGATFSNGDRLFGEDGLLVLTNCTFRGLSTGINIYGGRAQLTSCLVDSTAETGVTFSSVDSSYIRNSLITNSGDNGVKVRQSDLVEVTGNTLRGNSVNDFNHPALFFDSCSPQVVEQNLIEHNHAQGIGVWTLTATAAPTIRHNLIRYNFTGITIVNSPPLIENNIIVANYQLGNANSGAGIYAGYPSAQATVIQNYIAGNFYGISNITNATLNMGDVVNDFPGDDGENLFYDNTYNGETWNIWNGTAATLMAQNNHWIGLELNQVDATLWDNEEGAGEVVFEPIYAAVLPAPADLNDDSLVNVLDVVLVVEGVVEPLIPDAVSFYLSDINNDYLLDVNDVVLIVEMVIGG